MSQTHSTRRLAGWDWLRVTFLLGGALALYFLAPLLALFATQSPSAVFGQLQSPVVVDAATNSVTTATVSTLLATVFGVPLAYWLARTRSRWQLLVGGIVALPLVLPPIVSGIILLMLVGPNTTVGSLASLGGISLTRSLVGVVIAQTFVSAPFVVVTATTAFNGVDRTLEEAARTLGTTRSGAFRRVTLPLAKRGILAGMTLAFARSLGEFGATIMLAYYPRTMPVQIWVSFTTMGIENALPVAVILVGIAIAVLTVLAALGANPWE
ncbi:molybdate ABC transporter permease subunit [Haladaptatus sp. CMSO5]|uniref:molybdate ABC transporter permease subunit n=1 Tax=Haladaptatus sp. CMSO5 TaxID=3120514 RepID=UPI002FCE3223